MDNIEIFTDSQNRIHGNRELLKRTEASIRNTSVINEGFLSNKTPYFSDSHVFFEENLTLISAYKFTDKGLKTAILNFANPVEPGGGVLRGASAQEEYLCRASNLYPCLISEQAKDFYSKHNKILKYNQFKSMFLATDMLIYSPDITFFGKITIIIRILNATLLRSIQHIGGLLMLSPVLHLSLADPVIYYRTAIYTIYSAEESKTFSKRQLITMLKL